MNQRVLTGVLFGALSVGGILLWQGSLSATLDEELGLSKTSVFETPSPDPLIENPSEPGDRPVIGRINPEGPATIPHGLRDLLPITFVENQCMDCHEVDEKEEGEPTPIPPSHFTDFRNDPATVGETVVGARYNCISCHVSLSESEPLVKNLFAE